MCAHLQYKLANKYFKFLGARTKLNEETRYKNTRNYTHNFYLVFATAATS